MPARAWAAAHTRVDPVRGQSAKARSSLSGLHAPLELHGDCEVLTGVATTTSGLLRRVEAWSWEESPPTTSAARTSVNWARFCIMLCTCRDGDTE